MFLTLPVLLYKNDAEYKREAIFNPAQIISIEPDIKDVSVCYLVTANGREWEVQLGLPKVQALIKKFEEQNILSVHYKNLRNGSS